MWVFVYLCDMELPLKPGTPVQSSLRMSTANDSTLLAFKLIARKLREVYRRQTRVPCNSIQRVTANIDSERAQCARASTPPPKAASTRSIPPHAATPPTPHLAEAFTLRDAKCYLYSDFAIRLRITVDGFQFLLSYGTMRLDRTKLSFIPRQINRNPLQVLTQSFPPAPARRPRPARPPCELADS
ncbi:hypothetical protein EVAR_54242_1 [Eumeta japonica]|uniref:Uncharacterized protein n=1 Tax=Eumeta variegata TaxID=151549 RepID=A0A4C1YIM2_EUMVA|nr:hypothetical protein EVAR_54242_1 [Eumeta japonica]